jgi:Sulphur transport
VRCLLYDQYDKIFGSPWPVILSALVIAAVNVFLFAFERPWAASDGLRHWSNGLLQLFGLIQQPALLPPLLYSGSCLNLGLLLGAMASRQILVRTDLIRQYRFSRIGGLSERRLGRCASHGALVSRMRAGMSNVNNPTY